MEPNVPEINAINAEVDKIDREINTLRAKKHALAARRRDLIADDEIQIKLRGMTPEQRRRLILKPITGQG